MQEENTTTEVLEQETNTEQVEVGQETVDVEGQLSVEDLRRQVEEYKAKTFVPETYDLSPVEGVQEEDISIFTSIAKKANLNQEQALEVLQEYKGLMATQKTKVEEFKEQAKQNVIDTLTEEYGDKVRSKCQKVDKMISEMGSPELSDFITDSGLYLNPDFMKTMIKISDAVGEDSMATVAVNNSSKTTGVKTPQEAKKALRDFYSDKKARKILNDPMDPNRGSKIQELKELAFLAASE